MFLTKVKDESYDYEGFERSAGIGPYRTKTSIQEFFCMGDSSLYPMTFAASLHPEYIYYKMKDTEKREEAIDFICER